MVMAFYRSSDENMVGGVCAGLAHKWCLNRTGLRWATFLLTFFFGIPLFIYLACWMILAARPTRRAR